MKYYRNKIISYWLVLVIILISILLNNQYQTKQELFLLESNNLMTREHIVFRNKDNLEWIKNIDDSNSGVWVTGEKRNERFVLMSIYSSKLENVKIPISNGKAFSNKNSMEALVGKNIPVCTIGGDKYFEYNNKKYKVIGCLGTIENSPLNDVVLVNDVSLLKSNDVTLVLNGHDLDKINAIKGEKGENKGVERLLGISKFSRLVNYSTIAIAALSVMLWIYFFSLNYRNKYNVYRVLGITDRKIYFMELKMISILFIFSIVAIFPLVKYFNIEMTLMHRYLQLYIIMIIFDSIIFWGERKISYE